MADDPKGDPAKGDPDPSDLGDAGKKALDEERKARREAEKRTRDIEAELQALKDKDKPDIERLTTQLAAAEKRATEAEAKALRLEVAAEKGVKARWLTGSTREELEAAADEYIADHPQAGGDPAKGDPPKAPGKPAETLSGGTDPTQEPEEMNPAKLAADLPRY